jgi:imidazole glycerol-phosphate synthase subunit HisH
VIAIVDYGVGNLRSVQKALQRSGASPRLVSDQDELARANGMVLPGVGAFKPALDKLSEGGLGRRVVELARKGMPILGVCLGYQLMFERSEEHGVHSGLGLFEGSVVQIESSLRLPVIGWCRLQQTEWSPLWQGIEDAAYFYFVHSYTPDRSPHAIAATEHSTAAAAARANMMGTQFHPEMSAADGLRVYRNFLDICGAG